MGKLKAIFSIPELRWKIGFTLLLLAIYRIGYSIPLPFVDQREMNKPLAQGGIASVLNFVSMFSGGDLSHATLFGLGIFWLVPKFTQKVFMISRGRRLPRFFVLLIEWQKILLDLQERQKSMLPQSAIRTSIFMFIFCRSLLKNQISVLMCLDRMVGFHFFQKYLKPKNLIELTTVYARL